MKIAGPLRWIVLIILWAVLSACLKAAKVWPPVAPADLAMRESAAQPGADAIILDQSFDCAAVRNREDSYFVRLKILTEAGKSRGHIQIRYPEQLAKVVGLEARTIEPDGTVHAFTGPVSDNVVAQGNGQRWREKSFTMPDVRAGSILDYRYRVVWTFKGLVFPVWDIQSDLFIRHEHFSFAFLAGVGWISRGLNPLHPPVRHAGSSISTGVPTTTVRLDETNIPPLGDEPYSLPRDERAARVEFYYDPNTTTDQYWTRTGAWYADGTRRFIGNTDDLKPFVDGIAGKNVAAEDKLRAMYRYLLTLRNLSVEAIQAQGAPGLQHLKENKSVKDVFKRRYGQGNDISMAFVALARAAGFDAWIVVASFRDRALFLKDWPNGAQIENELVEVKVGDKDEFFEPGIGCPFGVVPWFNTAVAGMRIDQRGGTFVNTAPPSATHARIDRIGNFAITADGALQGELQVNFGGDEAFERNIAALPMNETARAQQLVDEVRTWLPERAEVHLETVNGRKTSDPVLKATFAVTVPGFARGEGSRLSFPQGILEAAEPPWFPSPHRQGMIYFHQVSQTTDEIRVALPAGFRVESLPPPAAVPAGANLDYQAGEQRLPSALHWHREIAINGILFPVKSYPEVRAFFTEVRRNDQQPVVLQRTATALEPGR